MQAELQRLIEFRLLEPVFQPIINLDGQRILGYEALIRGPQDSPLHTPDQLFGVARSSKQLAALEFACRAASCEKFVELGLSGKLFLNTSPLSFTDSQYRDGVTREILQRVGLSPERVVFELTESQPLDQFDLLRAASEHFQRQGFAVALDDLGAGYAGLRVWSELCPDYVKIDRHFISGVDKDPVKREFVRAMLDIAHRMGNKVIAEGIETSEEFNTLVAMGIENLQGYFFAKPARDPIRLFPDHIPQFQQPRHVRQHDFFRRTVGDIMVKVEVIAPKVSAETVVKMFRADVRLTCLPVVDGDRPLGMVSRAELLNIFSQPFAHDLYAKKSIMEFISPSSLTVDVNTELKAVGQLVTEDPNQNLSVDFIVSKQGAYAGVGKVRHLLRRITEEKLRAAKHSNPLTQLPGNVPLYEWIDHLLHSQEHFLVAYVDINHFKPFNDAFGYSYGDEIILELGNILTRQLDQARDFIGHVGGDDFILVFRSKDWRQRCEQIFGEFTAAYRKLLPRTDTEFWSHDRHGRRQRYGELTLAIGCVFPDSTSCTTHHQVSLLLADAKRSAKRLGGNSIFESRRRQAPVAAGEAFPLN
jgi:EAL domain-containing protein (putative c-di-GMP-specific phosphodiesterase class I)/GGDEF domain-containing protein